METVDVVNYPDIPDLTPENIEVVFGWEWEEDDKPIKKIIDHVNKRFQDMARTILTNSPDSIERRNSLRALKLAHLLVRVSIRNR